MAKRIVSLDGIEKEHEADQRTIDRRRSVTFREQVVSIGFGIGRCYFSCFEASMFLLQPGGKATSILGIERNGFGGKIRALFQCLLPGGNLLPHDSSLLSAQLHYRHSFWRDSPRNSADNIPQMGSNCADKAPLRRSSTDTKSA